jgi:kynureninase
MTHLTRSYFVKLDEQDQLAHFRNRFQLADDLIYLNGNSLGPLPKAVPRRIEQLINQEWGQDLIRSWNKHQWIDKPTTIGDKIARLIGAGPDEVLVTDTTSVNIFKLAAGAIAMRPERRKIVTELGNFATDLYLLQGLESLLGEAVEVCAVPRDEVISHIDDRTALVLLTHVHFKSGAMWNMTDITRLTHQHGALMLWDLSHSTGAMVVELNQCNVDLAVGCTYKYLNGGPGSPAFMYVSKRHQNQFKQPLTGWIGHARPFDFDDQYQPAAGIKQGLCGTPAVVANAALEVSVDLLLEADLLQVRKKSVAMGNLFIELIQQHGNWFNISSPVNGQVRGSQVSIIHPAGYAIMQALIARNIIGDFRAPDHLRFGFAPLYLRYVDLWDTVEALADIMTHHIWDCDQFKQHQAVT